MDITNLIDKVPESIVTDVMDFNDVRLKGGRDALRVTVDRLLNADEQKQLAKTKGIIYNTEMVCAYKYAPEIKKSYFYVVY